MAVTRLRTDDPYQNLLAAMANGQHHATPNSELIDQGARDPLGGRGDQYGIIWSVFSPAQPAVAVTQTHVAQPQVA